MHPQNRIGYHNILENEKEIVGNKNIIAKINSAEGLEDKEEVYRKHNTDSQEKKKIRNSGRSSDIATVQVLQ